MADNTLKYEITYKHYKVFGFNYLLVVGTRTHKRGHVTSRTCCAKTRNIMENILLVLLALLMKEYIMIESLRTGQFPVPGCSSD